MKLLAATLILASTGALGADIQFFPGNPERMIGHVGAIPNSWLPRITLAGSIGVGDAERFTEVLKQAQKQGKDWENLGSLQLDSEGGDVATAISIGRTVRRAQITTAVHDRSVCASACILILAGGTARYVQDNARLGLHRPYFSNPGAATANGYETFQQAYDSVISIHRAYFAEMRIGTGLLDRMLQVPSNQVQWINQATARSMNLIGEDATYSEWKRAKRNAKEGSECVDWQDNRYWPCIAKLGFDASDRCEAITNKPPQCK